MENARNRASIPGYSYRSVIPSDALLVIAEDQRERSLAHSNATQGTSLGGAQNPLGERGDEAIQDDFDASHALVNVGDILERFARNTTARFKDGGTTYEKYSWMFRRFAATPTPEKPLGMDLARYTRRQLAGDRGKELILAHMAKVPLASRRVVLAGIKCVWEEGVKLPWPINVRRDFGHTLPPVGGRETPPDEDIKPWAEAVRNENDPYVKAYVLCLLQYGWRDTNQAGRIKWRNLKSDAHAVIANGTQEGFKTHAWIVAALYPDVEEALGAWRQQSKAIAPEDFIFPWRSKNGTIDWVRPLDREAPSRILQAFEEKWGLKHLAPVYLRHWVKTTCRRLSDPAIAALQGHKAPKDRSMRNTYDTPGMERILDEQRTEFPHGPLGIFQSPVVSVAPENQAEMAAIIEWKAGRLKMSELMDRLDALQRKESPNAILEP